MDQLLPVDEAISKNLFDEVANAIIQNQELCKAFRTTPSKMREWCFYLNCHQGVSHCTIPKLPELPDNSTTGPPSISKCIDDFQCNLEYLSKYYCYVLGWTSLFISIAGIIANSFAIPTFTVASIASATTLYLIGIASADIGYLLMTVFILVPYNMPSEFDSQTEKYITFSTRIIPYMNPLLELFELMGVWFILCLLVDRYFYIKVGHRSKLILTKRKASIMMLATSGLLIIYTIPKYFYYTTENYENGFKVVISKFGRDYKDGFMNLKIPIEMMVPYLSILLLASYNTFVMIKTHSIRQKKLDVSDKANLTPRQLIELRENATVTCTICLAYFLLLTKIPKLLRETFLIQEVYKREDLEVLNLVVSIVNIFMAFIKPFFCVYIGYHFRNAIFAMFCCREQSELTQKIVDLDVKGYLPFVFSGTNTNANDQWNVFLNSKHLNIETYFDKNSPI